MVSNLAITSSPTAFCLKKKQQLKKISIKMHDGLFNVMSMASGARAREGGRARGMDFFSKLASRHISEKIKVCGPQRNLLEAINMHIVRATFTNATANAVKVHTT